MVRSLCASVFVHICVRIRVCACVFNFNQSVCIFSWSDHSSAGLRIRGGCLDQHLSEALSEWPHVYMSKGWVGPLLRLYCHGAISFYPWDPQMGVREHQREWSSPLLPVAYSPLRQTPQTLPLRTLFLPCERDKMTTSTLSISCHENVSQYFKNIFLNMSYLSSSRTTVLS